MSGGRRNKRGEGERAVRHFLLFHNPDAQSSVWATPPLERYEVAQNRYKERREGIRSEIEENLAVLKRRKP